MEASVVKAIKNRLDIVDVVRRYVDLRRAGARWVGPCPFHQETKPSFSVNQEEGFFYCFGCQAGGDVIDFYRMINGLEFKDALTQLAEEAGVKLQEFRPNPEEDRERELRQNCLQATALAARHFHENLLGPKGVEGREYLERRRLSPETIKSFGLGWAPDDWHDLDHSLRAKGVSEELAITAGLLSRSEKGNVYDRFRRRVIFPIISLANRVVAFGGRILTSDGPKYINSSETPIYTKGEHLYGLKQARVAVTQTRRVLLTEGYMDVLSLHQFGFQNACGVLGTALTEKQVKRLTGLCSQVDLIFDGDEAGSKAALRSAEMLLAHGVACRVVRLPMGEDVDSLLQTQGREALDDILAGPPGTVDGLDFCLSRVRERSSPREMLDWATRFLSNLDRPDLASYFLPRLAGGLGLDETELRRAKTRESTYETSPGGDEPPPSRPQAGATRDRDLLRFVVWYPHHLGLLEERGARDLLATDWALSFWDKVCGVTPEEAWPNMTDDEKRFWVQCCDQRSLSEAEEAEELAAICELLETARAREEGRTLIQALRQAGQGNSAGDEDEMAILRQLQERLGRHNGKH